jgi:hypothetical protein
MSWNSLPSALFLVILSICVIIVSTNESNPLNLHDIGQKTLKKSHSSHKTSKFRHNKTHKPTNVCNKGNIFVGNWSYHEIITINQQTNPFQFCPNALKMISHDLILKDHPQKWACWNSSYYDATFHPAYCQWMGLHDVFLKLKGKRIAFVGDSLSGQLFIAALCGLESSGFDFDHTEFKYYASAMLRPDLPCDPECLKNPKYVDPSGFILPCLACPDGIFWPFNGSFASYPHYWISKITPNTSAIVIGTGAWYNVWKKLTDPMASFRETVDKLAPIFYDFIHHRGIQVFWIDLPPISDFEWEISKLFGWHLYVEYMVYAKQRLEREGVILVESNLAAAPRKLRDNNITNHIHWCNPGRSTLPLFIDHAIFQLLLSLSSSAA